jgi:hypothetical protein
MTKAAAVMVCGGEKNCYYVFSILMFGEEAVCPDSLFVPAVFRESDFYLNSLNCTSIKCRRNRHAREETDDSPNSR